MWNQLLEQVLVTIMEENNQEPSSSQVLLSCRPTTLSQIICSQPNSSQSSSISDMMEITRAVEKFTDNSPFSVLSQRNQNTPLNDQVRYEPSQQSLFADTQQTKERRYKNDRSDDCNDDRLQSCCDQSSGDENSPPSGNLTETSLKLKLEPKGLGETLYADKLSICDANGLEYQVTAVFNKATIKREPYLNSINLATPMPDSRTWPFNRKFKRNSVGRRKKTPEQIVALKQEYKLNCYPEKEHRERLAKKLGLTDSQVRLWFQYERNKLADTMK